MTGEGSSAPPRQANGRRHSQAEGGRPKLLGKGGPYAIIGKGE